MAKELNEFFTSVGQNTVEKIYPLANECSYDLTQSSFVPTRYHSSQQFSFRSVNCGEVEKVITSLASDKAPEIDKISIRVIKHSLPAILPSVTSIINGSLASNTFSTQSEFLAQIISKKYKNSSEFSTVRVTCSFGVNSSDQYFHRNVYSDAHNY